MKNKALRIALFIVAGVVVFLVLLQLSFPLYFNKRINKSLQEAMKEKSHGEYVLKIKDLRVNVFNQSLTLEDISFASDKKIKPEKSKYFVGAKKIRLVDCNMLSYIFKKKLLVDKIEIEVPKASLTKGSENNGQPFSPYSAISKNFRSLEINTIEIENTDLKIFTKPNAKPLLASKDNKIIITEFKVNKKAEEQGKWFLSKKFEMRINRFSYNTEDGMYTLRIREIRASYTDSSLVLDSVYLQPAYSKREFGKAAGKQTDRIELYATRAQISKMDIKQLFERNDMVARRARIDSLTVSAYRDKNVPRIEKRVKSVQQLVKDLPIHVVVDSTIVTHCNIEYEEVPEGSSEPAMVSFNDFQINITGITNDSVLPDPKAAIMLNGQGSFMNTGKMEVNYSFPLKTRAFEFDCWGRLGKMELKPLNALLGGLANVEIKSGVLDSMHFYFHATDITSKGKLGLFYHDLEAGLKKDTDPASGPLKDFFTAIVSGVVIKFALNSSNPTRDKPPRITDINYERDPNRFLFNYSWKSLLSGLKPALGLPGKVKS